MELKEKNDLIQWMNDWLPKDPINQNKLIFSPDSFRIFRKWFLPNRFSFKCSYCSRKVSRESDEIYFSLTRESHEFQNYALPLGSWSVKRTCSENCMEGLIRHLIFDWVVNEGVRDYFNSENLEILIKFLVNDITDYKYWLPYGISEWYPKGYKDWDDFYKYIGENYHDTAIGLNCLISNGDDDFYAINW